MLINVHITWTATPSPLGFPSAVGTGYAFNTDTKQVEQVVTSWKGGFLTPQPADLYYADGFPIYYDCDNYAPGSSPTNYSATVYTYVRNGETVAATRVTDCAFCGYVPPDTRSCNILIDTVSVNYDRATVQCSKYVGPLQYSLDGGINRQTSNEFKELSVGKYKVSVYDLGATRQTCFNTKDFEISALPPSGAVAKVEPLPLFCFAGNPVIVRAQAAVPFHQVVTQVWVENEHRAGVFSLAYESQRRSDVAGQVQLDVQDVLLAQLANRLDITDEWRQLERAALNWFVRVADVLPQTGQPGTWATSNNSVVMLGGLAPEPLLAGADYWTSARVARLFHTWQPLNKRIGPQHLEVLQFLKPDAEEWTVRVKWFDAQGVALPTRLLAVPVPALRLPGANGIVPPPLDPAQEVQFYQLVLDAKTYYGASKLIVDVVATADIINSPNNPNNPAIRTFCWPRVYDVAIGQSPRQLIYQNSVGGHDTLAHFGKLSAKLSLDPSPVEAYRNSTGPLATTRQLRSWPGTPSTPGYSLATGWLSAEWLEYMQEVVQPGRDVYEYTGGQLRPVVLTTKELITYQETEGLTGAMLEYKPALLNEYYSDYARNTNQSPAVGAGW